MNDADIDELLAFLDEDLGRGDLTSESLIGAERTATASIRAGAPGVLAGLEEAAALAAARDLEVTTHAADGDRLAERQLVLGLSGSALTILGVERTLLNILSHLSGVATTTRGAVDAVTAAHTGLHAPHPPRIAATRKTLPGLRRLQKKAVVLGGGAPHRFDLGDAVLIKDNHLALVPGVAAAVARVRERLGDKVVEIEVETLAEAMSAAGAGAEILLLDNFEPDGLVEVVAALRSAGLRDAVSLEASGGIVPETVQRFADTGVDLISMGALTMAARPLDLSLHLNPSEP